MNKQATSISLIIILFILMGIFSACQSTENLDRRYPSTIGTFNNTGDLTINPMTILDALNRGEINVFTPTLATPSAETILPSGSIHWTQSDYLKVADALSQFVWKEPLEGWLIYHIAFNKECHDNLSGFDSADMIYYKTVGWQKMYTARYIQIYPLASIVSWGGGTDFPISDGWATIDLTKFRITADDALRIAEENGGKEARLKVGNKCNIFLSTSNHNDDDSWDLGYYYGVNFEMIIDPYSGKYEVPTPSP